MIHEIKIEKEFADAIISGDKNFEVRYNDRGYQKGDILKFKVVSGYLNVLSHPLNDMEYEITYVLSGFGLKDNYVVLSIKQK